MSRSFTRRDFLSTGASVGAAGALSGALGGSPLLHLGTHLPEKAAAPTVVAASRPKTTDRTLVLCTLYGGNDGLNTVVPYESGIYKSLRQGCSISESEALPIGEADNFKLGLHPAMQNIKTLWEAGQVAIILGVGYPNPNYSHFESMEIMQSADPSGDNPTGWVGRWLDVSGSGALRALSIGPNLPQVFAGARQQASTLADSTNPGDQEPDGDGVFVSAYRELQHVYRREIPLEADVGQMGTNMLVVGARAASALTSQKPPNSAAGANSGDIGNQFDVVAELIKAGLPTRAYGVSQNSFDTHTAELGTQFQLLAQLDGAVGNFMSAFPSHWGGLSPVILIYSEFGRRPESNASGGTDHGSANVVLAIGPTVKGGFYGDMQSLRRLDEYGNFIHTTDIRSVYATVLAEVFGVDPKGFFDRNYRRIGFL